MSLLRWYIDWRRGYSDIDIESLEAKLRPVHPQCSEAGSYIRLTQKEWKALKDMPATKYNEILEEPVL